MVRLQLGLGLPALPGELVCGALLPRRPPAIMPGRGGKPTEEDLAILLEETNFTAKEIAGFYSFGEGTTLDRQDFMELCAANGLTAPGLLQRMWDLFDDDDNGACSDLELVRALNPLMRGTLEDVAGMFFDLYDIDKDQNLTVPEIISVYSDLVRLTDGEPAKPGETGLTAEQRKRITAFVVDAKDTSTDGTLNKEGFTQAVREMVEATSESEPFFTPRNIFFLFITSWSEVGTSFALPAMGALSTRIKYRFDCGDAEIGSLTALYYGAAMIGPMMGGLAMDKIGPGWVVLFANVVVTLGALCQCVADGASMFWLLMVGRLLLGLGGEVTPFTSVEILGKLFPEYFGLMAVSTQAIPTTSGLNRAVE